MHIGTKKGNQVYNKWKRGKINLLEDLTREEKELTIFEKLQSKGKTNTLFDQLKYFIKER